MVPFFKSSVEGSYMGLPVKGSLLFFIKSSYQDSFWVSARVALRTLQVPEYL